MRINGIAANQQWLCNKMVADHFVMAIHGNKNTGLSGQLSGYVPAELKLRNVRSSMFCFLFLSATSRDSAEALESFARESHGAERRQMKDCGRSIA